MNKEKWMPYKGLIEVSNLGRVKSLDRIQLVAGVIIIKRATTHIKGANGILRLTMRKITC